MLVQNPVMLRNINIGIYICIEYIYMYIYTYITVKTQQIVISSSKNAKPS